MDRSLSLNDVERMLDMPEPVVMGLVEHHVLHPHERNGSLFFDSDDVERYAARRRRRAPYMAELYETSDMIARLERSNGVGG